MALTDGERLRLGERYAPEFRIILAGMRARGVADCDVVAVAWWGLHLLAIKFLETAEVRAFRTWLNDYTPPAEPRPRPTATLRHLRQVIQFVEILFTIWKIALLEGVPGDDIPDVLLAALGVVQAERQLAAFQAGLEEGDAR